MKIKVKKRVRLCLMVGLAVVVIAGGQAWGVPSLVNIQGRVTKGGVIQQNSLIIFTPTTTKTQLGTAMTDLNGIFNATLDFSTNYTNFPGAYSVRVYLNTTDDPNLIGTQVFNSVPYAFRAAVADTALNAAGGGLWTGTTDISNTNIGNVGIGATAPYSKLEIAAPGSSVNGSQLTLSNGTSSPKKVGLNFRIDVTDLYQLYADNTDANKLKLDYNNASNFLTVTTGGNFGIGTTAPGNKLSVANGDANITGKVGIGTVTTPTDQTSLINMGGAADTDSGMIRQSISYGENDHRVLTIYRRRGFMALQGGNEWTMQVRGATNPFLDFYRVGRPASPDGPEWLDDTEYASLTLAWNGNVGIGKKNPGAKLDVWGDFHVNDNVYLNKYIIPVGAGTPLVVTESATGIWRLRANTSSKRYKHDIRDYSLDTNKISELRPVKFKWNDETAMPNKDDFGLIAEEVYNVFPELVILSKDGNPESVQYDKVAVILLKGYQEKVKEIDELKTKNQDLEARVKALEEKVK
jgi:hypothetical protein